MPAVVSRFTDGMSRIQSLTMIPSKIEIQNYDGINLVMGSTRFLSIDY